MALSRRTILTRHLPSDTLDQMAATAISGCARRWVNGRRARGEIGDETAKRHRHVLHHFCESVGAIPVGRLSRRHVERWLATRSHVTPGSRRADWSIVKGFCQWLARERLLRRDPTADMRPPRQPRGVVRTLTGDEVACLRGALPDVRAHACLALMLCMGLRRGEVARLQLGDWDRGAALLYVLGKGGHSRVLPVPEAVRSALVEYLAVHPASAGPLIRSFRDNVSPVSAPYVGRLMSGWMRAAGVKEAGHDGKSAHALRRTLASSVADVEPDLRVVQEILGHARLATTEVYLRSRRDLGRMRAVLNRC